MNQKFKAGNNSHKSFSVRMKCIQAIFNIYTIHFYTVSSFLKDNKTVHIKLMELELYSFEIYIGSDKQILLMSVWLDEHITIFL